MRNLIIALIILMSASLMGQRTIDIRVIEAGLNQHTKTLKAEIQVRKTDRAILKLGGYNMRLYYDSQKLNLQEDKAQSMLSSTKYGSIVVDNHMKNVNVGGHGDIPYSDNLSFFSFSSNLKSLDTEGQSLENQEWVSIASLEFSIKETFQDQEVITLAREDKTGELATAFIEMTEWKAPKKIVALEVNEYFEEINGFDGENGTFVNVKVGPNPASTDLNIDFSQELEGNDYSVVIRDVSGALILNRRIDTGSKSFVMDIRELASANYLVEVRNDDEIIKTKKIIKVN